MANGTIGGINVEVSAEVDASGAVSGFAKISDSAKRVEADLKSMDATASSSGNAISAASNKAAKASKNAATAFKFQKGGMAQLGQQIQDVAVMSQFGADKFIILGTQGSQIASLFGPGGAVFGAVLAISAAIGGTLVKSLFDGGTATEELRDKLKELSKEYELTAEESAFLATEEAKTTKELQKRAEALKKLIAENEKEQKSRSNKTDSRVKGGSAGIRLAQRQKQAAKAVAETNTELEKQRAELVGIERQISKTELIKKGEQEKRDEFKRTAEIRLGLIKQGLSNDKELAMLERTNRQSVQEGIVSDEIAAARQRELVSNQALNAKFESLKIRLGNEKKLLIDSKLLEGEELATAQAEIDAAIVEADATKKSLLLNNEEAFAKALGEIKKKAADTEEKLARAKKETEIGYVSQTFSALSSLMNTESRKLFEIGKAAAISGAIVDGYAGVAKTLASVPAPFNYALAAAQAVAAAVQVQSIAKQKFGSTGNVTAFSGGVPAVNTQQATQQQTQTVDVRVTASGGGVVDMFNFEVANGASPIMG